MSEPENIDKLSIRGLTFEIAGYLKENGNTSDSKTVKGLLEVLLKNDQFMTVFEQVMGEDKASKFFIIEMQKAISGPSASSLIHELASQIAWTSDYDQVLLDRLHLVVEDIAHSNRTQFPDELYRILVDYASPLFFTQEELVILKHLLHTQQYEKLLLRLLKHGFAALDNMPQRIAQRLYEEALTYDYDNITRFYLFKIAADNDHKLAALEYGGYLNRTRPDGVVPEADVQGALKYTLKALPLSPAFWNLAYMLECHQLNEEQIDLVEKGTGINGLIEKLLKDRETGKITGRTIGNGGESIPHGVSVQTIPNSFLLALLHSVSPVSVGIQGRSDLLAFKICFYLAFREETFYKAFNSLAKYVDSDYRKHTLLFCPEESFPYQDGHKLALYLYQIAIQGGSPPAMCNVGIVLFKELQSQLQAGATEDTIDLQENIGSQTEYMLRLLRTSAESGFSRSYETLGDYYQINQELNEACKCYRNALDILPSAKAFMKLAKLEVNPEVRRQYYEQALALKESNAAYYLALLDYQQFMESNEKREKNYLLIRALSNISLHFQGMNDEYQENTSILRSQLKELLDHYTTMDSQ